MALSLDSIYQETKNLYHLDLICGKEGMDRIINWVYVAEDTTTTSFLRGGELVITTGMSKDSSPHWLYHFIQKLIHQHTCGLILNIGKYLSKDDITPEIRTLCEEHTFPLFTMPWNIHIYDITRHYSEQIFYDSKRTDTITEALLALIHHTDIPHALSILQQNGFPTDQSYCLCYITFDAIQENTPSFLSEVHSLPTHFSGITFYQLAARYLPNYHLCTTQEECILIVPTKERTLSSIITLFRQFLEQLSVTFHNYRIHGGIGTIALTVADLAKSYLHAKSAHTMARSKDELYYCFDQLGFFRILLCVNDKEILHNYCEEKLGKVKKYDTDHGGCYLETLYHYLIYQGSIIKTAQAMYCHRNTVNYRIHILKDTLGLEIDQTEVRFALMVAFLIEQYLQIFD